mmetsp:Transcript_5942/g.23488  ORF Transcript_5942/g.23488 Transcript_5942/m.23488 type:complete len:205 (-) Transcript_5942:38-652(-)
MPMAKHTTSSPSIPSWCARFMRRMRSCIRPTREEWRVTKSFKTRCDIASKSYTWRPSSVSPSRLCVKSRRRSSSRRTRPHSGPELAKKPPRRPSRRSPRRRNSSTSPRPTCARRLQRRSTTRSNTPQRRRKSSSKRTPRATSARRHWTKPRILRNRRRDAPSARASTPSTPSPTSSPPSRTSLPSNHKNHNHVLYDHRAERAPN